MNTNLIQRPARTLPRRAGFSLAELMVVIVILGLLATLVVPEVMSALGFGQVGKAKSDLTQISNAVTNYVIRNNGKYPSSISDLTTPDENGNSFLQGNEPKDPWGNPYVLEVFPAGEKPRYLVWCYGRDGGEGGEGEDLDFSHEMVANGDI